jgi:hypothetical protein
MMKELTNARHELETEKMRNTRVSRSAPGRKQSPLRPIPGASEIGPTPIVSSPPVVPETIKPAMASDDVASILKSLGL